MKQRSILQKCVTAAMIFLITCPAWADTGIKGDYGWDKFLRWIVTELQGPVVLGFGIIVVVICGLTAAFGDLQGSGKRAVYAGIGIGICLSATNILTNAFGLGAMI